MEHTELLLEMQQLDKIPLTERVKLAQKRRKQQLANYAKWTKTDTNSNKSKPKNRIHVKFTPDIQIMDIAARGSFEELRTFLKTGADPNMMNHDGLTALHQCCIDGSLDMVSLLLKHGADVNITDRDLWTPLHAAATCGHFKIVTTLIKAGANITAINGDGDMPHEITEEEVTLQYLENEMLKRGMSQNTIEEIHLGPHKAMLRDINSLLKTGGDLDQPQDQGSTFLHVAIANGYNDIVQLLQDNGASLTARDEDGWEPIHAAAYWNNEEAMDILLSDMRVNLRTCTSNRETPYELCDEPELKLKILHKLSETPDVYEVPDNFDPESLSQIYEEINLEECNEKQIIDSSEHSIADNKSFTLQDEQNFAEVESEEEFQDSRHSSIDDTPATPLMNIQTIEHPSDRRNSIKEAKNKALLKRISSERLNSMEKHNIVSNINKRLTDCSNGIKETVPPPDLPQFTHNNNVEDENHNYNSLFTNNVEPLDIHPPSSPSPAAQATNKTEEDSRLQEFFYRPRKKTAAPPPPKGSLLDLKRQRQENRQLQNQYLEEKHRSTEPTSTFYEPATLYNPPPSPTLYHYQYKMVLIDDDAGNKFIKEKKCTIM
ncbi:protein phosphatase 1 regulatory subunit 16A-like [Homarus americanus]|uniref:Phosphatase 1 regulatory subunit 16A-like 1 n=1 Tax=Homarus americanus TaxID=6706 RepID=A0A8J5JQM4_HOMAM|nr:protein phosphatase 1 regulatory subunit 16A-like [Homarus americanus]KAG7157419.1 phosphatase 1 regulatory subunit 16A-like 1 [Homarus americanus]